jgi:hypothetical protein
MCDGIVTEGEATDEETETDAYLQGGWRRQPQRQQEKKQRESPRRAGPRVGDQCVILSGKVGRDVGQQGRVTEIKPVMVEVEYQEYQSDRIVCKNKRQSSLLMLEKGLQIVRDRKGTLWVRRSEGPVE